MTARQRSAGLALLICCGCLLAALTCDRRLQGAFPVPARTAQRPVPSSPEPPLADFPVVPAPAPGAGTALGSPFPADPPVPVVALRVRVPACGAAGQELASHACVEHCSRAPAHPVLLRSPLPPGPRFVRAPPQPTAQEPELLWQLDTLEPCACRNIVLVLLPTGPGDLKDCFRVQFEHGECVCTHVAPAPAPRSELSLVKRGPAHATLYHALTYQLTVTNNGTTPLTGVTLTDTLPDGLEYTPPPGGGGAAAADKGVLKWDVGTLAPGQSRVIDYQALAKATGRLCNQAVAVTASGLRPGA